MAATIVANLSIPVASPSRPKNLKIKTWSCGGYFGGLIFIDGYVLWAATCDFCYIVTAKLLACSQLRSMLQRKFAGTLGG